jgi:hypothetical protein
MSGAREGLGLFFEEKTVVIATQCGTSSSCPQCIKL